MGAKGDSGCERRELSKAEFEREGRKRGREIWGQREGEGVRRAGVKPMSGTQLQATGKP